MCHRSSLCSSPCKSTIMYTSHSVELCIEILKSHVDTSDALCGMLKALDAMKPADPLAAGKGKCNLAKRHKWRTALCLPFNRGWTKKIVCSLKGCGNFFDVARLVRSFSVYESVFACLARCCELQTVCPGQLLGADSVPSSILNINRGPIFMRIRQRTGYCALVYE